MSKTCISSTSTCYNINMLLTCYYSNKNNIFRIIEIHCLLYFSQTLWMQDFYLKLSFFSAASLLTEEIWMLQKPVIELNKNEHKI